MIKVNGKNIEWTPNISFSDIYKKIGYTISNPRVIVRVDGETVSKSDRKEYEIADLSEIVIINTLCGG